MVIYANGLPMIWAVFTPYQKDFYARTEEGIMGTEMAHTTLFTLYQTGVVNKFTKEFIWHALLKDHNSDPSSFHPRTLITFHPTTIRSLANFAGFLEVMLQNLLCFLR